MAERSHLPARVTLTGRMSFLFAGAAGTLLPLALAPFDLPLLDLVSVAVLYALVSRSPPAKAALLGWCYGVGKYGLGASWIYVSIHDYGNASPALAGALVGLFVAAMALFPSAMTAAYASMRERADTARRPVLDALAFVACYVGLEWLLTWVLTGFPWLYLGYAHLEDPLRHWAPIAGVLSVSLAAAISAVAVVLALRAASTRQRAVAVLIALLPWAAGAALGTLRFYERGDSGRVALVQGNISQDLKWLSENAQPILDTYRHLSAGHWRTDLVIWPEAAVTLFEHQAGDFLEEMAARARAGGSALGLGLPALEVGPDRSVAFLNTAQVVGKGHGRYVKCRLVPFGEYVPLEGLLRGFIDFFDLPMSRAAAGAAVQPLLVANGRRLAMAICYEVVYPELLRRSAADADLLVTISNDAWFGASIGPHQHLQMARMRALENGRWLLRATNNGITAIVDAEGRVTDRLPQFEAGVLEGEFVVARGLTPFTRLGPGPVLALLAALLLAPWLDRGRARRQRVRGTQRV